MQAPDYDEVAAAVDKLLGDHIAGMVTSWSMVVEHIEPDEAIPGVTFVNAPGQPLGATIAHARMMTLFTEAEFAAWYDDGMGYDDE